MIIYVNYLTINDFLINNKRREDDTKENFDEFTFNFEEDNIDNKLQNIIIQLDNGGVQYYRNLK